MVVYPPICSVFFIGFHIDPSCRIASINGSKNHCDEIDVLSVL